MAKAHYFDDGFNDPEISIYDPVTNPTGRWETPTSTYIREVNGRLEIRPPGNQTGSSYHQYVSGNTWDLTDSEIRVELVRPLVRSGNAHTYLKVVDDALNASNQLSFTVIRAKLQAAVTLNNVSTLVADRPYDPALHRWLRLREQAGTVYWEVSADGADWTVLGSRSPNPFDLTSIKVVVGAGTNAALPAPGTAIFDNVGARNTSMARRVEERRRSARDVRDEASRVAAERRHDEHFNNNDEVNYPGKRFAGNYSKGLKHDSAGDPDPESYGTLLRALQSEDPGDFEEIALGVIPSDARRLRLTNPQAGLAFDIAGPDAQAFTMPPAPRLDSEVAAHEAGELYWMAVARDVWFGRYATDADPLNPADTIIERAIASLNTEFPQFGGTKTVNAQNLFRGIYPGEQVGPYVSQFLLKGNVDPRKLVEQGRDAEEGFISYGARTIDQRLRPAAAGTDYLTSFATWLDVQNGVDKRGQDSFDTARLFIRNLRDGATFVHFDQVIDAFYNAAWILMSEPAGDQKLAANATGRPQIDPEFPKDDGNVYVPGRSAARTQTGFATFGPIHLLQALSEVLGRALRAVWWQKWGVHRRLRPEEYGGRVHNHITGARTYPLHTSITTSLQSGGLAPHFGGQAGDTSTPKFPSYLLPQAYPEGAPTHPAYGTGHGVGAGACATILKAFFDEDAAIQNPVLASADGLSLVTYGGADAAQMKVGGELNKLAGNIAIFRNAAGVHWRSDYTESLPFGEAIAIGLLQEMSLGFNEDDAVFALTRFDGQEIRIFDGKVVPVV
jgi:hypothetical protein